MFEGIVGTSFSGDIAIDDFMMLEKPCPPPGDCDFSGECTWHNTPLDDDFDWTQGVGRTNTAENSGPSADHTTGTLEGINFITLIRSAAINFNIFLQRATVDIVVIILFENYGAVLI